jgi:hypothetical protein
MAEGMNPLPSMALLSMSLLACTGHMEVIGARGGDDGGSGDGNPAQECPQWAQVDPGGTCSSNGLTCPSNLLTGCPNSHYGDQSVDCTCISGVWECAGSGGCPGPPVGVCPDPSQVVEGTGCYADPTLWCANTDVTRDCDGGVFAQGACQCIGNAWQCAIDAGIPLCLGEAGVSEGGWGPDAGASDAPLGD